MIFVAVLFVFCTFHVAESVEGVRWELKIHRWQFIMRACATRRESNLLSWQLYFVNDINLTKFLVQLPEPELRKHNLANPGYRATLDVLPITTLRDLEASQANDCWFALCFMNPSPGLCNANRAKWVLQIILSPLFRLPSSTILTIWSWFLEPLRVFGRHSDYVFLLSLLSWYNHTQHS